MTKAAIYTRVSTRSQADPEKVSLSTQRDDCLAKAKELGCEVLEVITDVESGTSKAREGFQRICEMITNREVDVVIAWREDRLFRGIRAVIPLLDALDRNRKAKIQLVHGHFDKRHAALLAAAYQIELDSIAERTKYTKRQIAKNGRYVGEGRPPYGFSFDKKEPSGLVINERESLVVKRAFDEYVDGNSISAIAKGLTADGITPPSGRAGKWHRSPIHRILSNQAYIGRLQYLQRRTYKIDDRKRIVEKRPPSEQIEIPCPAIIDELQFNQVQYRLQESAKYLKKKPKDEFLLRGRVFCSECGKVFHACSASGKQVPEYRHKPRKDALGEQCQLSRSIRRDLLEPQVWQQVQAVYTDRSRLADLFDAALEQADSDREQNAERIESLTKELERISSRIDRWDDALMDGNYAKDEYLEKRRVMTDQREKILHKLSLLDVGRQDVELEQVRRWLDDLAEAMPLPAKIKKLTQDEAPELIDWDRRHRMLDALRTRVVIGEGEQPLIQFRFLDPQPSGFRRSVPT
jgi:site-specific DNA recombinase